ncbi:hypothetical protein EMCRGX_G023948 [Ephydatia muelleri]
MEDNIVLLSAKNMRQIKADIASVTLKMDSNQPDMEDHHPVLIRKHMSFIGGLIAILIFLQVTELSLGIGLELYFNSAKLGVTGDNQPYQHAAVAADAAACSQVGVDVLKKGGSAVDAAVASMFCVGVVNLHFTGIGGGGFMVYYNATSRKSTFIDYSEVAPRAATLNMFTNVSSTTGGLAVAVPGELKGLEKAWRMFGRLPWAELVQPSIDIARKGFNVSREIDKAIQSKLTYINSGKFPGLLELIAPNNVTLKLGDIIKRPLLADMLANISQYGSDYFYNSPFTSEMVTELQQDYGSILTEEDFQNYNAQVRDVLSSQFSGLQVLGASPPSSGAVVALVLNILEGYNFTSQDLGGLSYHRIVEAFKFAYAQRMQLGDPAFNSTVEQVVQYMLNISAAERMRSLITDNTTHNVSYYELPELFSPLSPTGTSHLSVLAPNGDAVSVTGTINNHFGSLICSRKSGIIFNDGMDDFGTPSKECSTCQIPNYIQPGKRPQSSMSPTIMLDKNGKVKMVVGASGGSKIPTGVLQVILDVLRFNKTLSDAIAYPRLYHQLIPDYVSVEDDFPLEYRQALESRGHIVKALGDYAVVQGIEVIDGLIYATSDPRKGGAPAGY